MDAIPGRWWARFDEYRPVQCGDGLPGPELAATYGKWKRLLVKVKATVHERTRVATLKYIINHCPDRFYMAISAVEACLSEGMTSEQAVRITANALHAGESSVRSTQGKNICSHHRTKKHTQAAGSSAKFAACSPASP